MLLMGKAIILEPAWNQVITSSARIAIKDANNVGARSKISWAVVDTVQSLDQSFGHLNIKEGVAPVLENLCSHLV